MSGVAHRLQAVPSGDAAAHTNPYHGVAPEASTDRPGHRLRGRRDDLAAADPLGPPRLLAIRDHASDATAISPRFARLPRLVGLRPPGMDRPLLALLRRDVH